jgi:hypothetical protein
MSLITFFTASIKVWSEGFWVPHIALLTYVSMHAHTCSAGFKSGDLDGLLTVSIPSSASVLSVEAAV